MKKLNLIAVVLFSLAVFTTGCKKYENGPAISLRSKKARLVNKWKIDKVVDKSGKDQALSQVQNAITYVEIKKDETFVIGYNLGSGETTANGTWKFDDPKEKVVMTASVTLIQGLPPTDIEFGGIITKLKEKDLWILDETDSSTVYYVPF